MQYLDTREYQPFGWEIVSAIKEHAQDEYPNECCGFVIGGELGPEYLRCRNVAKDPSNAFEFSPEDSRLAVTGAVKAVVHSHVNGTPFPSEGDQRGQIATGLPWGIVNVNKGGAADPFWWGGDWDIPYVGRRWKHVSRDCFSLLRDFYRREFGIKVPQIVYSFLSHEETPVHRYEELGFYNLEIKSREELFTKIRRGDALLMSYSHRQKLICDHIGIFNGNAGVLHHRYGHPSQHEPLYSLLGVLVAVVRHNSFKETV